MNAIAGKDHHTHVPLVPIVVARDLRSEMHPYCYTCLYCIHGSGCGKPTSPLKPLLLRH